MIKYHISLATLAIIFLASFITSGCSGISLWGSDDTYDDGDSGGGLFSGRRHKKKQDFFSFDTETRDLRCGQLIKAFDGRIVGGKMASIADFPWIVSLQREKGFWFGFRYFFHSCGGSLITPSWIVTAAHCIYKKDPFKRVVAGTDDLDYLYRAQVRYITKVIMHPDFVPETYDNDIALIKVDNPFNIESKFSQVATICLERNIPILAYDIATIAGFGASAFHESSKKHLYTTEIAIIDQGICNVSFSDAITDNMICAGGMISNKRDACSGDSGGPMQMDNGDHVSLVGIVSFGNSCATQGFPGIYTKADNYYDWIMSHIDETIYEP